MPQSKETLQRILRVTEQQLAQIEARLVETLCEEERSNVINRAADLQIKSRELRDLLRGEA
jgi:hypothetical protein